MFDANDLLKLIKKSSMDAMKASKPTDIVFGKVISAPPSPLKIKVDQKLILTSKQLILSRNVTEHKIEMTVNHTTEDANAGTTHNHNYSGRKEFTVHNDLKVDEKVIMIRLSGGQVYLVIDRMGKEREE